MTRTEIDDPRKWRVSRSGYSIKTGWGDEKRILVHKPADVSWEAWLELAEQVCEQHNATLPELP